MKEKEVQKINVLDRNDSQRFCFSNFLSSPNILSSSESSSKQFRFFSLICNRWGVTIVSRTVVRNGREFFLNKPRNVKTPETSTTQIPIVTKIPIPLLFILYFFSQEKISVNTHIEELSWEQVIVKMGKLKSSVLTKRKIPKKVKIKSSK